VRPCGARPVSCAACARAVWRAPRVVCCMRSCRVARAPCRVLHALVPCGARPGSCAACARAALRATGASPRACALALRRAAVRGAWAA
jgi:hypothetical protein